MIECIFMNELVYSIIYESTSFDINVFLHGAAAILRRMASILSNVLDILHVQHQFFGIFKGKNTKDPNEMKWQLYFVLSQAVS